MLTRLLRHRLRSTGLFGLQFCFLAAALTLSSDAFAAGAKADADNDRRIRERSMLTLDSGQREIQEAMYNWAELWYDLSYVRNSTPPSEDRSDPYMNTRPGFACRETDISLADNIEDFPLFAAVPSNVFPGSIIKGDTLLTNTYGVFSGPRNSGKITINSPYTSQTIGTETMSPISQSQYLDAMRRILKGGIGNVPASTGFLIERIFSQDQLAFKMKANVSGKSFDVAAQFSIDSTETRQYVLVSVTQVFFRVYMERPDYGAELFANDLSRQDIDFIKKEMTQYNPPLYVSAMDYGRKAYVLFESSDSALDVKAMVSAGYKGVVDAEGEVNTEVKKALESMSARGFIIGGSSKLGSNAITELFSGGSDDGFDALKGLHKWIEEGAEPSDQNPPAALGYEFALLLDGSKSLARTTTNYKEKDCDVGVCPSGFFWGKKYKSSWFEIKPVPKSKIYPAAGLIGDEIQIQNGRFYTYDFPTCNRVYWDNVALKCVPNERRDFEAGVSPPGVWDWTDVVDGNGKKLKRDIGTDNHCIDSNAEQDNASARRINSDGGPPYPLDKGDEGFAEHPQDYWKWRE